MKTPYPITNYEMTEDDLKTLLDACKPTPAIMIGGYSPATPQENANSAWANLGEKMGFDWNTVQPIQGKGTRFFSAVPTEPEKVREEREALEADETKQTRIKEIMAKVDELQAELKKLKD